MYAIKYSATSLGLILCNLNVFDVGVIDDGMNRLYRQLENVLPKMIFTLDMFEDKIYKVINDPKFSSAIKVSMSLEKLDKQVLHSRLAPEPENYISVQTVRMDGQFIANPMD